MPTENEKRKLLEEEHRKERLRLLLLEQELERKRQATLAEEERKRRLEQELKTIRAEEQRLIKLIEEEERASTRISRRTSFSEFYHLQDEYGNRVELEDLNLC